MKLLSSFTLLLLLLSCNNNFTKNEESRQLVKWNNKDVFLLEGVNEAEIYSSDDQILEIFTANAISRSIDFGEESPFTISDFSNVIDNIKDDFNLPNFEASTDEEHYMNLEIIQQDFPNLTLEEIAENYTEIIDLYMTQIKILTANEANTYRGGVNEDGIYWGDDTLTWYETQACLKHPLSAPTLPTVKKKAWELTGDTFNSNGKQTDTKEDAFRHAVLNILMAKHGVGLKSEKLKWAKDFATAHELGPKDFGIPSHMDLHNNDIGRKIYDRSARKKYLVFKVFGKVISKKEIGVKEPKDSYIKDIVKQFVDSAVFIPGYDKNDKHKNEKTVEAAIDTKVGKLVYILK